MEALKKYKTLIIMAICFVVVIGCCLYIMLDDGDEPDETAGGSDIIAEYDISVTGDGSIKAALYKNGTLEIVGKGDIKDMGADIPWLDHVNKIKNVTIPAGITAIGDYTFYHCTLLAEIVIPEGVTRIGDHAFDGSQVAKVTLPTTLTEIGEYAFDGCPITELVLPAALRDIGYRAFQNCKKLAKLDIMQGVTGIGDRVFYGCTELKSINVPESLTFIGSGAFHNCQKLESVVFEHKAGWYLAEKRGDTEGEMVSVIVSTDNALNLSSDKSDFYWKRNA